MNIRKLYHKEKTMLTVSKVRCNILLAVSFSVLVLFTGCSDDKSPTKAKETYQFTVVFGTSSSVVELNDLTKYTIENLEAVKLSDLVDTTLVTEPDNYTYRIIGTDGFYANVKGSPDNTWEHIQDGYILLSTMAVSFDPSLELISRYNIKDAAEMKILRKIDFITPADSLIQYVVDDMTQVAFEDTLTGVALTEFIPSEVISDPAAFSYSLIAVDDYSQTMTYGQLLEGYYVIEEDRVLYTNPDISGKLKIKMLNRIAAVSVQK
jgi:hypothetical protein